MFGAFALAGGLGVVPGAGVVQADTGSGPTVARITVPDPVEGSFEGDVYLDADFSGTLTLALIYETGEEPGFGGSSGPEFQDSGLRTKVTFDRRSSGHYAFADFRAISNAKSYRVEVVAAEMPSGMNPRSAIIRSEIGHAPALDLYWGNDKHRHDDDHCTTTVTDTVTKTKTKTATTTQYRTITTTKFKTLTVTITRPVTVTKTVLVPTTITATVTKTITATVTSVGTVTTTTTATVTSVGTVTVTQTSTTTVTITGGFTTTTTTGTTTFTTLNQAPGPVVPPRFTLGVEPRGLMASLLSRI